jgi:hypothetical protein
MKKTAFFLFAVILISGHFLFSQALVTKQYKVEAETDGHKAMAIIKAKPFDPKRHRIEMTKEGNGSFCSKVDGLIPRGEDGGVPRVEITGIIAWMDGKMIPIEKALYSDCFEPNLSKDHVKLRLSEDGQAALLTMSNGDGAGGYDVTWVISKKAPSARFLDTLCSESLD